MSATKKVAILGPGSHVFTHICNNVARACDLEVLAPMRVLGDYKRSINESTRSIVPDDMIAKILMESAEKQKRCLIYAYPLSVEHTKYFFENAKLDAFVHLSIDYRYAARDFHYRYMHIPTGAHYHLKYDRPSDHLMKSFNSNVFKKKPLKSIPHFRAAFNDCLERNNAIAEYISSKIKTLKIDNAEDYEAAIPKIIDFIKDE